MMLLLMLMISLTTSFANDFFYQGASTLDSSAIMQLQVELESDVESTASRLSRRMYGVGGVTFLYHGYIRTTDENGCISFPCLLKTPSLTVIITQNMHPIASPGHVVSQFVISNDQIAHQYNCTSVITEKTITWKATCVSKNFTGSVPKDALIIYGDPLLISFDFKSSEMALSQNIMLPHLIAKKEFTRGINALSSLDLKPSNTSLLTKRYELEPNTQHQQASVFVV